MNFSPEREEDFETRLVADGHVTPRQIEEARVFRASMGSRGNVLHLGQILMRMGVLSGATVANVLAALAGSEPAPPGAPAGTSTGPLRPGATFQGYEILDLAGAGATSLVYRARQANLGRVVALKVARFPEDSKVLDRFVREAKLAGRLDHPSIVKVNEVGNASGSWFISMEFVEGRTLEEILQDGPLEIARAIRIAAELADAVGYAHERGVLHRDLKPANVLIDAGDRARIADFGLAKPIRGLHVDLAASLTTTGAILGTPQYMSPEQILGDTARVDERTDVFGLGAILYGMLTGRGRSAATSLTQLLREVRSRVVIPGPRSVRPEIPIELDRVCTSCLAWTPEDRPASARQLAAELRSLERSPVRPVRRGGRRRAALAAALAVVIGSISLGVFRSRGPAAPSVGPPAEEPAREVLRSAVSIPDGLNALWVYPPSGGISAERGYVLFLPRGSTSPARHQAWIDHLTGLGRTVFYFEYDDAQDVEDLRGSLPRLMDLFHDRHPESADELGGGRYWIVGEGRGTKFAVMATTTLLNAGKRLPGAYVFIDPSSITRREWVALLGWDSRWKELPVETFLLGVCTEAASGEAQGSLERFFDATKSIPPVQKQILVLPRQPTGGSIPPDGDPLWEVVDELLERSGSD